MIEKINNKNLSTNHKTFIDSINRQISEMRLKPADESYFQIVEIAIMLIEYRKKTGIKIF